MRQTPDDDAARAYALDLIRAGQDLIARLDAPGPRPWPCYTPSAAVRLADVVVAAAADRVAAALETPRSPETPGVVP